MRVTVPSACPSAVSTTISTPGATSAIKSGSKNDIVRPAGVNLTLTKEDICQFPVSVAG
jgi:hypothetical protein